jgi:hypothetical protein
MIRHSSSRHGCVVPVRSFWWFSKPFLGNFLREISRPFSWGFFGGSMHEPFVVLFPLIPLPNLWEKGLHFGVFVVLGFGVFLAEILRFLLFQWVLVDHNLAMKCPWGVPTIPIVLFETVERIRRSGVGFGGVDTGFCSSRATQVRPVWPVLLTGLTGVNPLWDLPWVSCLIRVSLVCAIASQFLICLVLFC